MNISQETINKITDLIDMNNQIYQKRVKFESYCKNTLRLTKNLYDFCSYDEFLANSQSGTDDELLEVVVENQPYIEKYYQELYIEIKNNKQILSLVKQDIFGYIKTQDIISVEQIGRDGFGFLPDFYIEFFLDGLTQNGHLEKIHNPEKNLYQIIRK